jgi:amino acid transporter
LVKQQGKMGLVGAVATCVGLIVATNVFMTLSQGVGFAGRGIIIPMVLVCILNIFVALSFSELNGLMPGSGGISSYTLAAMGPFVSLVAVVGGYLICQIFAATAEAALIGFVINAAFLPSIPPVVISLAIVIFLFIVNILGIRSFAMTQIIVTGFLILSMLVFGLAGVLGINAGTPVVQEFTSFNHMGWGVIALAPLAFWLFIGVEFITPLTKDLKNPKRDVPLAMISGLLLLLVVQIIMAFALNKYLPADVLANSTQPHVDFAQALFNRPGVMWMGLVSVAAAISTLNTVFSSISRLCFGMAAEGMLPKIFTKVNRWRSPGWGLTILFVLFFFILVTGITTAQDITFLILTGCLFWMVSYVIAHIDVLVLRKRYPDRERSFKCFGKGIPQIIGIIGTAIMIFNIHPEPDMRTRIYSMAAIWAIILIVYSAVWVKLKMKTQLFKPVSIDEVLAREEEVRKLEEKYLGDGASLSS